MDGVLVVDKPPGMTSHDVVAAVRRAIGPQARPRRGTVKVGHAGTLDPDATGVLVVAVGRATKLVPYLQASTKTYDARLRLGQQTTTLDASGDVTARTDASGVDEAALCDALQSFVGDVWQVPPMVSAVKVDGERLHVKARRGEEVERAARRVTISEIVLADFEPGPDAEASLLVTCSAGTYVRTLADDVGTKLGVGGHLVALRRLASGRFSTEGAVDLDTLAALAADGRLTDALVPMAGAVADLPRRDVDADEADRLSHGRTLAATGVDGPVAAVDGDGRLLAVVADDGDQAKARVVLAAAGT